MSWFVKKTTKTTKTPVGVTVSLSGEDTKLGSCSVCGCAVADIRWERHVEWHKSLESGRCTNTEQR